MMHVLDNANRWYDPTMTHGLLRSTLEQTVWWIIDAPSVPEILHTAGTETSPTKSTFKGLPKRPYSDHECNHI